MNILNRGGGSMIIKRQFIALWGILLAFLLIVLVLCRIFCFPNGRVAFSAAVNDTDTIFVLDAGHGGEDGGALSRDGDRESEINLAIVKKLDALFQFLGQKTVLTRKEDISIYSDDAQTLREKKASDLRNRVSIVNAAPGGVLISIHQNSLPMVPSVHGAQVFFGSVERSALLALSVQTALNQSVNSGNTKKEKAIDPSIYLMRKAERPAILVECGFMTNPAEVIKLKSPEYQTILAVGIAAGVLCAA